MRISHLFDDPLVKALCEAAERDEGDAPAIVIRAPVLSGGAAAPMRQRRLFLAAGPAGNVFADLRAAVEAERELASA